MIYVPEDNVFNKCYVVQSTGVIRAYDTVPRNNTHYNYRDYYLESNYIYRDGEGSWGNYSTLPICLSTDFITNDFYYRNDFPDILFMFCVFSFFIIFVPFKILFRLFRRFN